MAEQPTPQRFTDRVGRDWLVDINYTTIVAVRRALDVDLLDIGNPDGKLLSTLFDDPITRVAVLYVLCSDQAASRQITEEDFGRAMAGDAILAATEALLNSLIDFFPDPRRRDNLRGLIKKIRTAETLMLQLGKDKLDQIDPATVANESIASSGSSPESSASTPAPSPSANSPGWPRDAAATSGSTPP